MLSHTCVVLKTYDAIYSVVYVLESNAFYRSPILGHNTVFLNAAGTLLQYSFGSPFVVV